MDKTTKKTIYTLNGRMVVKSGAYIVRCSRCGREEFSRAKYGEKQECPRCSCSVAFGRKA